MKHTIIKYGHTWPDTTHPVVIEMKAIQWGGKWKSNGRGCGEGLFHHYKALQTLLWPGLDHHRWSDLVLKSILENNIIAILGPKSSGKTHNVARFALTDYFCFPHNTGILISSTTLDAMQIRIWGEIKKLFKLAKERFDWLSGHLVEYKHCLSTDDIEDGVRDFRNGVVGIPCMVGTKYVGLGKYVGFKNNRVRLFADEAQFMGGGFLDAISNLDGNDDFKAVILGNPVDPTDQLGRAAEPEVGYSSLPEPTKTTTWKTRFMEGIAINLVGTDSPNFDYPESEKPRYRYLIDQRRINNVAKFWGKDSHQYYSQCVGVMKQGLTARRVITRQICIAQKAFEGVVWGPGPHRKIYAIDAAYSGTDGDRCVAGHVETGFGMDGGEIIRVGIPKIVPVSVGDSGNSPEDQIANFVQQDIAELGIKPDEVFYDSTGRGTLGAAFARVFGTSVPVPVEFGGSATERPVRHDLFMFDEKTKRKRLVTCYEFYRKLVSELWFSVRYCIESGQMRELPEDVAHEGYQREWCLVSGNKVEVESKLDMKERVGFSPDLFDWLATAVEGARRSGFKIQRLGVELVVNPGTNWVEQLGKKHGDLWRSKSLTTK